jgi:hypothetical protein
MFLGEDLLAYLVLAIGGALAVGNILALARPPEEAAEGDLERAPVARSLVMVAIGTLAALWAAGSLILG